MFFYSGCCSLLPKPIRLQELWSHGRRHSWEPRALYAHVFKLFDTHISTKEALEDVIGELSYFARSRNKNIFKSLSPEKALVKNCCSVRWRQEEFPLMKASMEDFRDRQVCSFPRARAHVFVGKQAKKHKFEMNRMMKEFVEQKFPGGRANLRLEVWLVLLLRWGAPILATGIAGKADAMPAAGDESRQIKPASQEADRRSVAAMVALRKLCTRDFVGAGALWVGALLQRGLYFQEKVPAAAGPGRVYVSLGFHFAAAALWQLTDVGNQRFQLAPASVSVDECRTRLKFVSLVDMVADGTTDEFEGVPTEICWALRYGVRMALGVFVNCLIRHVCVSRFAE